MLGKVKDFFGIEGVRILIEFDEEPQKSSGLLKGKLLISSLRKQTVTSLSLKLTEKYQRGRKEEKLIDTYQLGLLETPTDLTIQAQEEVVLPFKLQFQERLSPVESLAKKSLLLRPFTLLANKTFGAKSTFHLTASAKVQGVKLDPVTKIEVFE